MRRALLALVTAAAIAAAIAIPASPASGGIFGTSIPVDADLAVSVESLPETVTPVGSHVVYRVTWSLSGGLPSVAASMTSAVTATAPGAAIVDINGDFTGCQQDSATQVSCSALLKIASTQTFDLVVVTPSDTNGSTVTNSVSTTSMLLGPAEDTSNNTDSASTVVTNDPGQAYAFVPPNSCLEYEGQQLCTPGPEYTNGVFARLAQSSAAATATCGTDTKGRPVCEGGLHVGFLDVPGYGADDPNGPLTVYATTSKGICNGIGDNSGCADVLKLGDGETTPVPVGDCLTDGIADPDPCIDSVTPVEDGAGARDYVIRMTSEDPDLLGIVFSVTGL